MSIEVQHLTKKYGSQAAVNDITFSVKKGEVIGFIGPNGSGKSTTMKCMCGILPADQGQIKISGMDVLKDGLMVRKQIGYLPEHNPLYLDMYVQEYLLHVDRFYSSGANRRKRIAHAISLTGLQREQHKKIRQLSKGYRQRVGLAQAIIHDPDILILDEPTTGLDPNQIVEIRTLVSNLAHDKTVILSTHILQEVEAICDRILLINQGRIVADDKTSSIGRSKENLQTIYLEFSKPVEEQLLAKIPGIKSTKALNEKEFLLEGTGKKDLREDIFNYAAQNKLTLLTIQLRKETLEEVFRKLTSEN